jgi:hypothetical protein
MSTRLILTFATLHQVLAAEKTLRTAVQASFGVRPTPTPPGLGAAICGMSIEILDQDQKEDILQFLRGKQLPPIGVHYVSN